jgi:hypothetical protein
MDHGRYGVQGPEILMWPMIIIIMLEHEFKKLREDWIYYLNVFFCMKLNESGYKPLFVSVCMCFCSLDIELVLKKSWTLSIKKKTKNKKILKLLQNTLLKGKTLIKKAFTPFQKVVQTVFLKSSNFFVKN